MSTEQVVCLLAVLMSTTFLADVHCHQNAMLKMMVDMQDMRDQMRDSVNLKLLPSHEWESTIFLLPSLAAYIQDHLRNLKKNIQVLDASSSLRDRKYWVFTNILTNHPFIRNYQFYSSNPETSTKMLYRSVNLEAIVRYLRTFVYRAATDMLSKEEKKQCRHPNTVLLQGKIITINHVCTSLNACANVARPYETRDTESAADEEDVTTACTADHKCNVKKALPMMIGMFYSKVYEMAFRHQCCRLLSRDKQCEGYLRSYDDVIHEADVLIAYTYSIPTFWTPLWNSFFKDAISNNAHVDIDVAVSIMEEKRKDFEILRVACQVLQFAEACVYDDIYKQYEIIDRIKKNRDNPMHIKDLRLHQQMDHAKMVELQIIKSNQIEILGSVRALDENLQASVSGLSDFFGELANFDKGIADADAAFVSGEVAKYTTALTKVENKLGDDLREMMGYMVAVLGTQLVEQVTLLAIKVATNMNPLKMIFAGPDITDIANLANDVADAAANLAQGIALIISLKQLAYDSETLAAAFISNGEQLSTVKSLKDQILGGQADNLNEDADTFLDQYSAYTPQTDRSSLAKNDALWSAFKDAGCDLLGTDTGVISSIPKGIAQGKLLCERLDGTLAQYFTLREDIFDFQFQFIDALAGIVRGNLAQRLSENIRGNGDAVSGAQLLTTSFLAQSVLQTVASSYCDVIEYKLLVALPSVFCSGKKILTHWLRTLQALQPIMK